MLRTAALHMMHCTCCCASLRTSGRSLSVLLVLEEALYLTVSADFFAFVGFHGQAYYETLLSLSVILAYAEIDQKLTPVHKVATSSAPTCICEYLRVCIERPQYGSEIEAYKSFRSIRVSSARKRLQSASADLYCPVRYSSAAREQPPSGFSAGGCRTGDGASPVPSRIIFPCQRMPNLFSSHG